MSVRVWPVPPIHKGGDNLRISEENYLICPSCDRYTKVKVIPGLTVMKKFPLYCQKCKKTFLIDFE